MTTHTLTLTLSHVRAALLLAGVADIRNYLNGLHIEAHPGRIFIVGTDGAHMGIFRTDDAEDSREPVDFIIPRALLDGIKADKNTHAITVEFDPESKALTVQAGPATYKGSAIDAKYPDWRRAMPVEPASGEPSQFDPAYIADFAKAAKILGLRDTTPYIHHNGRGAALVEFPSVPYFRGVLTPYTHAETFSPSSPESVASFIAATTEPACDLA